MGGRGAYSATALLNYVSKHYVSSKAELLKNAKPGTGTITFEPGAKLNSAERKSVDWIHDNLGGDIRVLRPSDKEGEKTADILHNGLPLELKNTAGTLGTIDTHMRKAIKQSDGKVFMDVSGVAESNKVVISKIKIRLDRKGGQFVIVVRDGNLVDYIYKK